MSRPDAGGRSIDVNGLPYYVEIDGQGEPLLLLHGFTGCVRDWDAVAKELTHSFLVIRVDLIGHGRTGAPHDGARYSMEKSVDDLIALGDKLGIRRFHLAGYSMGGRLALHIALEHGSRLKSLILESASCGIEAPAERAQRKRSDHALADEIERDGIEAFVAKWEELPLFATQKSLPKSVRQAQRHQRLMQRPHGLANSLRGMGAGSQECLFPRVKEIDTPTLLVVGAADEKYRDIASTLQLAMPRAKVSIIDGAGHNVHLEQPRAFVHHVLSFLQGRKEKDVHKENQEV